ncbi:MAG: hypothetical protein WAM28_02150 [Chlamydiales bacterium]
MTTYHLSIHKSCSSYAGMETFSSQELQLDNEQDFSQAKQLCENRKNMAGFWKQTVLPIRTDRASDFFAPTLMNLVIKTKNLSENFFAVLGAIFWDLATLPIRFVTFLPRVAYNALATPVEHPLISYLRGRRIRFLDQDVRVNVLLYTKEITEDRIEKRSGKEYSLLLTDREIAFPIYREIIFATRSSLDNRPLPGLVNLLNGLNS